MTEPTVLYINQGLNRTVRTLENLNETNDLTTGQTFLAVANYYKKTKADYPRWISFRKNRDGFEAMKEHIEGCSTDMEKLGLACDWLGEERLV